MKIGLIRHGRTSWNAEGRLQGRTDIPITPDESNRLSTLQLPTEWRDAALLASPLSRASETARLISDKPPTTDARLIEMDFGTFEGQRGEDLKADPANGFRDIEDWTWDYCPHGGESPRDLWTRVAPALADLTEDTLIVSHLGVMRVILAKAHGWHYVGPAPFRVKRDRIYEITLEGGTMTPTPDPTRLVPRCA